MRGKGSRSAEVRRFRRAINKVKADSTTDGADTDPLSAKRLLECLRECELVVPPKSTKVGSQTWREKVWGWIYWYALKWIKLGPALTGFTQSEEFGKMPKTKN